MKALAMIILSILVVSAHGQENTPAFDGHHWEAPYHLPIPQNWTVERFPIPIAFAPDIPYAGVEDIRFAPGWGNATSDEYWSYAFLWYLDGDVDLDSRNIESYLQSYYRGLIAVNGSNIPGVELIPVHTSFRKGKKEQGDLSTYTGTITMLDYMSHSDITLNCKAHLKTCEGEDKTFVFFQLSPQPVSHDVWVSLDQLWLDFRCNKG